ncbi:MAG: ABC transporter ATP-binding protein [Pseudomonadota bacterium]|nr:ABC transporter ATP-binding protein [Pseudomonadota bacterium]
MSVFEVNNINVFYGRTQRLFEVDLPPLQSGDVLGLLGANAAGKSTLMRTLAGQQDFRGGAIRFAGQELQRHRARHWLAGVGFMPQTPPQESALRPFELLWSAARALGVTLSDQALTQRIEALLARLGLAERAMAPLYSLSGGKRQLVGLALALIRDPQLMLLDEPTSALDLHWRMVVLDLVQERVQAQQGIAIAALHDLDLAARYCTQLVMLEQGRVVAAGPVAEVLNPANIARVFKVEAQVEIGPMGYPRVQVLNAIRHPG